MMYRTVQTASEAMMPIGRSRCGLRASSAAVETASKPIYAKKISDAPFITPLKPNGMKLSQFAGLTCPAATKMKRMTTVSLMSTAAVLTHLLAVTPGAQQAGQCRDDAHGGKVHQSALSHVRRCGDCCGVAVYQ